MRRRKTRPGDLLMGALLVIGVIVIAAADNSMGAGGLLAVVILAAAGIVFFKYAQRQRRLEYLRDKYTDEEIVQRIMRRGMWQGQTAEQLRDSIGNPMAVDNKIMATRKREIWKYKRMGRNRYGLRITLDNDVVIGWDQKN